MAARRSAGRADELLARAVGRGTSVGVADGPCATGSTELRRREPDGPVERRVDAGVARIEPARRSDAVHDVAQ